MTRFRAILVWIVAGSTLGPAPVFGAPLIYSTHVAYRGVDGHRFAGDAIVYAKWLWPVATTSAGFRVRNALRARSLSSGPFRLTSAFEVGHAFDVAPAASSALQYLLYVPGIYGTSQAVGHLRWIDIQSFSLGGSRPAGGQVKLSDFAIGKTTDPSSPLLWIDANNGNFLDNGSSRLTMQVWQPNGTGEGDVYLSLTFFDATIDGYGLAASAGGVPGDTASFSFRKVTICVTSQTATGKQGTATCATYNSGSAT